MYGLVVQEHFNDLVVGTCGRGFWIMDDITPLQQMTDAVVSSDVHLFEPRDAYRFHNRTSPQTPNIDMSQGQVRMRTTPLYADWVDLGPDRVRIRGGGIDVMVPPGSYTVTLEVDGVERGATALAVLKDPNSDGSQAEILAQTEIMLALRDDYDEAADAINRLLEGMGAGRVIADGG